MKGPGSLLAAAILAAACAEPQPLAPEEPAPLGLGEYERRLELEAGGPASAMLLAARALAAEKVIQERLDRLTQRIEPGASWQSLFSGLRRQHPADVEELLELYRREIRGAESFLRQRDLVTLPEGELEVVEVENLVLRSVFPLALYLDGKLAVTTSSAAHEQPEYLVNHCLVCIPPLAVHEAYPGHHVGFFIMDRVQQERHLEGDPDLSAPPGSRYSRFFVEGWGLYAELLMLQEGFYTEPERELGAWRMLLLRAVRASVDVRLHGEQIDRQEAVRLYREKLQMSPEAAETEVRRHLKDPTMKASYFAGLLQILELRQRAGWSEPSSGLRRFHDRLLAGAAYPPRVTIPEVARRDFGVELGQLGEEPLDLGTPGR